MLRITALMDDKCSENGALSAEHGLSLFVECNGRRILFDCGSGSNSLRNAHLLGIDLGGLDAVILSHSHYDHSGGFRELTERGFGSGQVYTGPRFFEPKYARSDAGYRDLSAGFDREFLDAHCICHQQVEGAVEIFPGVYLISGFPRVHDFEQIPERFLRRVDGEFIPDDFHDEICMAVEVEGGLAVLVGCSHPGILNMIVHVCNILSKPVKAVFGGTHLVEADEKRIDTTVERLRDMGLEILGLNHCSGDAAERAICAKTEIRGCHLRVGDAISFD